MPWASPWLETERADLARELLAEAQVQQVQIALPSDHVIAREITADAPTRLVADEGIPPGWMGLDIGLQTIQRFRDAIAPARTVLWNGPMGVFELEPFRQGTLEMANAVAPR